MPPNPWEPGPAWAPPGDALLWWFGGVLITLVALVLLTRLLIRVADKRRCRSCGYARRGLPGDVCPECGRDPRSRMVVALLRRGWSRALPLLFAAAVCAVPIVRHRGVVGVTPSWILMHSAKDADPADVGTLRIPNPHPPVGWRASAWWELRRRDQRGDISVGQLRRWFEISGVLDPQPVPLGSLYPDTRARLGFEPDAETAPGYARRINSPITGRANRVVVLAPEMLDSVDIHDADAEARSLNGGFPAPAISPLRFKPSPVLDLYQDGTGGASFGLGYPKLLFPEPPTTITVRLERKTPPGNLYMITDNAEYFEVATITVPVGD